MAEDFTTYTLGGADSASLSATSTRITHTTLNGDDDAYAYKDYGSGNFGDFELQFTVRSNTQQSASLVGYVALDNSGAQNMGDMNTSNDGIVMGFQRQGTDGWFLREYETGSNNSNVVADTAFQTRYITFTKSGTTLTLNVYSDSGRTTHITGSPVTVTTSDIDHQYLYACSSGGSEGIASQGSGYVDSLEIISAGGGSDATVSPSAQEMSVSVLSPSISISQDSPLGELFLSEWQPSISATSNQTPAQQELSLSILSPSVDTSGNKTINPSQLEIVSSVLQEVDLVDYEVIPVSASVSILSPTVNISFSVSSLGLTLSQWQEDRFVSIDVSSLDLSLEILSPVLTFTGLLEPSVLSAILSILSPTIQSSDVREKVLATKHIQNRIHTYIDRDKITKISETPSQLRLSEQKKLQSENFIR